MNKGIKDIKNISLTLEEKKLIFNNVMEISIVSPYAPTPSLWDFVRNKFAYATAFLLIISMTVGTLAYADEYSLPGDMLYPIKRHITEPIRDVLAVTATSRAEWEAAKAMRRLAEAETLAEESNLTPEHRDQIEKDFNKNVEAFHNNIKSISTSTHEGDDLKASFEKSMKGHSDILQKISSHKSDGEQHEVDTLQETVLRASDTKVPETDTNKGDESTNKASSSQKDSEKGKDTQKSDGRDN